MKKITLLFICILMIVFVNGQTAEEIVQKHIEKTGGEKAWNEIKSIQMNAKLNSSGGLIDIVSINKKGKFVGLRKMNGEYVVDFAFDGAIRWETNFRSMKPQKRSEEASLRSKKGAKDFPSDFIVAKKYGYKIELMGEENIQGEDCYHLQLTKGKIPKNGKLVDDVSISYISKKTFLQVLVEREYKRGAHESTLYTYYSDYREVDGILLPFSINQIIDESHMVIQVDSYEINGKIDESVFDFKQ